MWRDGSELVQTGIQTALHGVPIRELPVLLQACGVTTVCIDEAGIQEFDGEVEGELLLSDTFPQGGEFTSDFVPIDFFQKAGDFGTSQNIPHVIWMGLGE